MTLAQGAAPEATATREAELAELDDLRTRAAETPEPAVCTPAATATPEPTPTPVPPVPAGQSLPYGEDWTVTATGIGTSATVETIPATGIFAVVTLTVTNEASVALRFPADDFELVDDVGRISAPALTVTAIANRALPEELRPGTPANLVLVFDVAADVGSTFVLQSRTVPTFRVQLGQELRG